MCARIVKEKVFVESLVLKNGCEKVKMVFEIVECGIHPNVCFVKRGFSF